MEGRHVNGQPENPGGVALFDLDGTLLAWDTQVLFCGHVVRREGWRRLLLLPWLLASPLAPVLGAGRMKRKLPAAGRAGTMASRRRAGIWESQRDSVPQPGVAERSGATPGTRPHTNRQP